MEKMRIEKKKTCVSASRNTLEELLAVLYE